MDARTKTVYIVRPDKDCTAEKAKLLEDHIFAVQCRHLEQAFGEMVRPAVVLVDEATMAVTAHPAAISGMVQAFKIAGAQIKELVEH
jgi:hypothetical protein